MGAYEFNPPMEAQMRFTPQMLNCNSKGKWVKAHFTLPEGFLPENVDVNEPAVLTIEPAQMQIASHHMNVFVDNEAFVKVEVAFDRQSFCDALSDDNGSIDVEVVGYLTTGQSFYGLDTIRIKARH